MARCNVCFRHCEIPEGKVGFCGARICEDGIVRAANYGVVSALALDPIEKKPLNRFMAGSRILSVGSYGCNLRCPFCQNSEISWSKEALRMASQAMQMTQASQAKLKPAPQVTQVTPRQLADTAAYYRSEGNVGLAFTYNEPLIGYEFVRDTAKLVHEAGMVNVLVTNGTAEVEILDEIAPYIDAMNIDLKGFTDRYYEDVLGGNRQMVMRFIERAVQICHVELTTLIIPGENDSAEEMREMCAWIASLGGADKAVDGSRDGSADGATDEAVCKRGTQRGRDIPLHISRFFPQFHMTDRPATSVKKVYELADVAREQLNYVYTGNC